MVRDSSLFDGRPHCPKFAAALLGAMIVGVFAFSCGSSPTVSAQVTEDADNDGLGNAADPCPSDPRNLCYGLVAVDQTTGKEIRINAGAKKNVECSGPRVDCNGHLWNADFAYNVSGKTGVCNLEGAGEACTIAGVADIFGCDSDSTQDLFRCEHFDRAIAPELTYTFAVENGEYLVNLLFANTFVTTVDPDARLFDIVVDGAVAYPAFDQVSRPAAAASPWSARRSSTSATASST